MPRAVIFLNGWDARAIINLWWNFFLSMHTYICIYIYIYVYIYLHIRIHIRSFIFGNGSSLEQIWLRMKTNCKYQLWIWLPSPAFWLNWAAMSRNQKFPGMVYFLIDMGLLQHKYGCPSARASMGQPPGVCGMLSTKWRSAARPSLHPSSHIRPSGGCPVGWTLADIYIYI